MVSGLRRLWHDEGVLIFVSLTVSPHASLTIGPSCLTAGGALPSRSPRLARTVRKAGRRPVSRSVAPTRFSLFRLPYSAVFSTSPCLAASMSLRVRKPIALHRVRSRVRPALLPVRSLRPSRCRLQSFHSSAASPFDCVLMMNAVVRGDFPAFAVLKSKAKIERIPQWIISTISSQSP